MNAIPIVAAAAVMLTAAAASAQTAQESNIAGVTTEIAYARQYNGALHVGVRFRNTTSRPSPSAPAILLSKMTVVENGRKHFPLKDASGHYIGGPISDWNEGGRWFAHIEGGRSVLFWAVFDPVQASKIDVIVPESQPFDAVPISTTAPAAALEVGAPMGDLRVSLVSATRAEGQLKVRIKIAGPSRQGAGGPGIVYADAYVLDPASKKKYLLVKDEDGNYQAQPVSDASKGGRYFLSRVPANGQVFMSLTFSAPPDAVRSVDIVVPELDPIENVPIAGQGGSGDAGQAVTGRTIGLEQALRDLHAAVTPQQVRVNLSADVLFDFDKAELKAAAEPMLAELATVLKAYPGSTVAIEGHTDAKGNDAYNQTLSERRAQAVAQWLVARGAAPAAQLRTRGFGRTRPVAPNTKPDGSDDPDGRAKNRRVEITIVKNG